MRLDRLEGLLLAGRRPGFIDAAIRRVDERLVGMQNG